jgi:hypothetical protein
MTRKLTRKHIPKRNEWFEEMTATPIVKRASRIVEATVAELPDGTPVQKAELFEHALTLAAVPNAMLERWLRQHNFGRKKAASVAAIIKRARQRQERAG